MIRKKIRNKRDCQRFFEDNRLESVNVFTIQYIKKRNRFAVFNFKSKLQTTIIRINQRQLTKKVNIRMNEKESIIYKSKSVRKILYTERVFPKNSAYKYHKIEEHVDFLFAGP